MSVHELGGTRTIPRNGILYRASAREFDLAVSGTELDRSMAKLFGGPDGIRTVVFPRTVRCVRQESFH